MRGGWRTGGARGTIGLEHRRIGHGKWACRFAGTGTGPVCAKERLTAAARVRVATGWRESKKSSVNKQRRHRKWAVWAVD